MSVFDYSLCDGEGNINESCVLDSDHICGIHALLKRYNWILADCLSKCYKELVGDHGPLNELDNRMRKLEPEKRNDVVGRAISMYDKRVNGERGVIQRKCKLKSEPIKERLNGKTPIVDENGFFDIKLSAINDGYTVYNCVTKCPVYREWM
jgi:hypothetical protein